MISYTHEIYRILVAPGLEVANLVFVSDDLV